jgi:GTP-binding protein HflX
LIGIRERQTQKNEAESLARELVSLTGTLGLEIAGEETVHIRENHARYGMGSGKAAELAEKAAAVEADCLVFDREISPSQQRNWEELSSLSVIDRQELILQIFAGRARTREAVLQVKLAELYYSLPRLQHKYIDLNRQRGGRYGTRGSGETRLETDRRLVEQRIHKVEEDLEEVRRQRETQRRQRRRQGIPVCALTGYTNAGKSSLLNALTDAGVLAEDKLFATLDSTSRRLRLPGGLSVLMADTVGFIRRLPHTLINAFRSTLEEVSQADLVIHVLDASDEDIAGQYETTLSVLEELKAGAITRITVLNKADRPEAAARLEEFREKWKALPVSASTGAGLSGLLEQIESVLSGEIRCFSFPQSRPDLAALLYRSGAVISEKYSGEQIEMEARVDKATEGKLKEFIRGEV